MASRLALALGVVVSASAWTMQGCHRREPNQRSCADEVADMRATFEPLARALEQHARLPPLRLHRGEGEVVEAETFVAITEFALFYDRDRLGELADPGGLAPANGLARLIERIETKRPTAIALAIDERAPWSAIVETVEVAARTGARLELLVFEELPPGPVDPKLADPGSAMLELERSIGDCPAALRVWQPASSGHDPLVDVLRELPDAVESCGCKGDVEGLRKTIETLSSPAARLSAFTLEPGTKATVTIRRAPETRWSEVADRVLAAAPLVRLEVEDDESIVPPEPAPEPQ